MTKLETTKDAMTKMVNPVSEAKELKCKLHEAIWGLNSILAQPTVNGNTITKPINVHSEARKMAEFLLVKIRLQIFGFSIQK